MTKKTSPRKPQASFRVVKWDKCSMGGGWCVMIQWHGDQISELKVIPEGEPRVPFKAIWRSLATISFTEYLEALKP